MQARANLTICLKRVSFYLCEEIIKNQRKVNIMLNKKGLAFCAMFSSLALQADAPKATANKIAFANFNQFMSLEGTTSNLQEFNDKVNKLQEELQKKEADVMKLEQELRKGIEALENMKKSGIGSEDAMKKRSEELMKKQQEREMAIRAGQEYYQKTIQAAFEELKNKAKVVVEKIRKADGWDSVIINYGGLEIVTEKQFDITDRVKTELDTEYAKLKKAEEAKKAAAKK